MREGRQMTDKDRKACRLVVAILDESQDLYRVAKWLLEHVEPEMVQGVLDI